MLEAGSDFSYRHGVISLGEGERETLHMGSGPGAPIFATGKQSFEFGNDELGHGKLRTITKVVMVDIYTLLLPMPVKTIKDKRVEKISNFAYTGYYAFIKGSEAYVSGEHEIAFKLWENFAEVIPPQTEAGLRHQYRPGRGVTPEFAMALNWARKAAERGNHTAQYNMGVLYQYGQGVPQDDAEALRWYTLSAEQGYSRVTGQPQTGT